MKGITMAQYANEIRITVFVNPPKLPLLYEISGPVHLGSYGRLADKMEVNFEIFKIHICS